MVTTGKIQGRRDRGKQREKMLDGLTSWFEKISMSKLITCTKQRELWRDMIAYAGRHDT